MRAALLLVLLAIPYAPASAQRIPPTPFARAGLGYRSPSPTAGARVPAEGIEAGKMVLGGVLLGVGGLIGGALIGQQFESSPCEDCILGAFFGALAGESLAIPLGVHLGNGGRGDVGPGLAASLGIAAAGLGAAALSREGGVLLAIPVLRSPHRSPSNATRPRVIPELTTGGSSSTLRIQHSQGGGGHEGLWLQRHSQRGVRRPRGQR